jgi:NADH dehydrogenase
MATISKFSAVMSVPVPGLKKNFETEGFFAWLGWLLLHLVYIVGFRNRLTTIVDWSFAFLTRGRSQLTITEQQVLARNAMDQLAQIELDRLKEGGAVPADRNQTPGSKPVLSDPTKSFTAEHSSGQSKPAAS